MTDVSHTLAERGARYGAFTDHAGICQALKRVMKSTDGWGRLNDAQMQALETIADKIARILNGDPNYGDNWHDIQGYAKLVEDTLVAAAPEPAPQPAIPPGWTKWQWGSKIPKGDVEVARRDGSKHAGDAISFIWRTYNAESDIVAYRPIGDD